MSGVAKLFEKFVGVLSVVGFVQAQVLGLGIDGSLRRLLARVGQQFTLFDQARKTFDVVAIRCRKMYRRKPRPSI